MSVFDVTFPWLSLPVVSVYWLIIENYGFALRPPPSVDMWGIVTGSM